MAQIAPVYEVGLNGPRYVGKLEFQQPLRANGTNSYILQRQRHEVRIDRIEPAHWSSASEIIPTVYVSPVVAPRSETTRRRSDIRTKS
jgi:hypothetical protein